MGDQREDPPARRFLRRLASNRAFLITFVVLDITWMTVELLLPLHTTLRVDRIIGIPVALVAVLLIWRAIDRRKERR